MLGGDPRTLLVAPDPLELGLYEASLRRALDVCRRRDEQLAVLIAMRVGDLFRR
jgi:hypothetical protein